MAFSDFKNIEQVLAQYPLAVVRDKFLPDVELELPAWFMQLLTFGLEAQAVQESETFFRESFIFPFLQLAWLDHARLKIWINHPLNYDDTLYGEPDYFVAMRTTQQVIRKLVNKPLLAVAEAKRQDFEVGWAQCLAEMIACQKLNEDSNLTVYGVVTTGTIWQFGKLQEITFTQDPRAYSMTDPQKIYGVLDFVFQECEQQLDKPGKQ